MSKRVVIPINLKHVLTFSRYYIFLEAIKITFLHRHSPRPFGTTTAPRLSNRSQLPYAYYFRLVTNVLFYLMFILYHAPENYVHTYSYIAEKEKFAVLANSSLKQQYREQYCLFIFFSDIGAG